MPRGNEALGGVLMIDAEIEPGEAERQIVMGH